MQSEIFDVWSHIYTRVSVLFGGATFASGSLFSLSEWIPMVGLIVAIASLLISWRYKRLNYQLNLKQFKKKLIFEGKDHE
jgi:hypothetical protein